MIELSPADVAAAVHGTLHVPVSGRAPAPADIDRVVIDSREVTPGALFVAMKGERADGHDFAVAAHAAGAGLVLAERLLPDVPCVIVDDSVTALGRLARYVLSQLPGLTVIGVTGSSGKTSTKDLIAQVLATHGPTVAAPGSHNNEIGLPLTALDADLTTRFLVLEMGARSPGHLSYLCEIARPAIGVVLNVGLAHVGEFGSIEATARAKAELVATLPADGTAVLNADDPHVIGMRSATSARVLTYGAAGAIRAVDNRSDDRNRPAFTLVTSHGTAAVRLNLHGEHQVSNALAAAAAASVAGMEPAAIATALSAAHPASRWRMEVRDRADGVTVINDAYNANPDSMQAALKALAALAGGRRRTWAVLGEMLELGGHSVREHEAIGRLAVRLDVAHLVVVGDGAGPIHQAASQEHSWAGASVCVPDAPAAIALLRRELAPGDVVLVKASRGIGLERVADALLADGGSAA